jgi:hypothetical protein
MSSVTIAPRAKLHPKIRGIVNHNGSEENFSKAENAWLRIVEIFFVGFLSSEDGADEKGPFVSAKGSILASTGAAIRGILRGIDLRILDSPAFES